MYFWGTIAKICPAQQKERKNNHQEPRKIYSKIPQNLLHNPKSEKHLRKWTQLPPSTPFKILCILWDPLANKFYKLWKTVSSRSSLLFAFVVLDNVRKHIFQFAELLEWKSNGIWQIKGVATEATEATYDNDSEKVFDDKFNSSAHALNIRNILPSSSAKQHIYMLKILVYGYY